MSEKLTILQDKLEDRHHVFMVYKSQVNKDLQRSGYESIEINEPKEFLDALVSLLNEAIEDSDPKLQQLYYLADVQEKNLEQGIILGFIMREWSKIQFRLRQ
ncbi:MULTISPECIES: hypothetical protein [Nonlabens]|uniref:Uncharacterized protein n=1 Tax=Nonlabens xylanidelens TaxID=191564 RepID=A0A2S6IRQ6_9FLAO|nr:hypothetical protein [Nonlabens xylanidelens]PPK96927.1 hypothetical protein LY01_00752 [Nonlabens xylanidelens]PQJ13625.1 hypothetical protein BST94_14835 [Nonlabens xylanidelens]